MSIEGLLYKWTNYMSGWKPRYFTVKDGILSYYRSQEEIKSGCKGSVKLAVCDVIVYTTDNRRFDLILGEQRFYLRALSHTDRQRWVVALGTCKASGITEGNVEDKTEFVYASADAIGRQGQAIANHQSELRLYYNVMAQQVKEIRSSLKEQTIPDIQRIDEMTSTLNAACSTFLSTLDELMVLTQCHSVRTSAQLCKLPHHMLLLPPSSSPSLSQSVDHIRYADLPLGQGRTDLQSWFPGGDSLTGQPMSPGGQRRSGSLTRRCQTFFSSMEYSFEDLRPAMPDAGDNNNNNNNDLLPGDYLQAAEFSNACRCLFTIFDRLDALHLARQSAPRGAGALFLWCHTGMQQVRADLMGNLGRLEFAIKTNNNSQQLLQKQHNNSGVTRQQEHITGETASEDTPAGEQVAAAAAVGKPASVSIGQLVRADWSNGCTGNPASVYQAILWLSRSLNFVREFLHLLFLLPTPPPPPPPPPQPLSATPTDALPDVAAAEGRPALSPTDNNLSVAATEAYIRCLRPFHQWSLRGVAMITIKSLPTSYHFLEALLMEPQHQQQQQPAHLTVHNQAPRPLYEPSYLQLQIDARRFAEAIGRTLTLIESLFACLDLDRVFTGSETY